MPIPLISRRTLLRGVGAAVALPWLEAMGPLQSWAADTPAKQAAPNRLAVLYVPNGKNMADWTPKKDGADFDLPAILEPLAAHRSDLLVLTGLTAAAGAGSQPSQWRYGPQALSRNSCIAWTKLPTVCGRLCGVNHSPVTLPATGCAACYVPGGGRESGTAGPRRPPPCLAHSGAG